MTRWGLLLRSLWHYRRAHAVVLLGAALSTGILTGALLVGDSVRFSLRRLVALRLGQCQVAVVGAERFVQQDLARRLHSVVGGRTAAVLQLRGAAGTPTGEARANDVWVQGVDRAFWDMAPGQITFAPPSGNEAVLNRTLAQRLRVEPGDVVLVRVENPGLMPRAAPLSEEERLSAALRLTVKAVTADSGFGRFSLRASQVAPLNVFVDRDMLAERLDLPGRANVILAGATGERRLTAADVRQAVRDCWSLADAGLTLERLDSGILELRSERVFMPDAAAAAAARDPRAQGSILTYFANSIDSATAQSPYAFVAGVDGLPDAVGENEVIVNRWLAADLEVGAGDRVTVRYYVMGALRTLEERSTTLRVHEVVPLEGRYADASVMPAFPGFAGADSCTDWNPGVPIDLKRVRDKDEDYWEAHRGTPKAWVTLSTAKRLWANRFGTVTAVRFEADAEPDAVRRRLRTGLDPEACGIHVADVLREGLQAADESVDFGQLFLGLSFFLICAALLLTALLFALGVQRRAAQIGLLLALGFEPRTVVFLMFAEGGLVALAAMPIGLGLALVYNRMVVAALRTVWRGTVGTVDLWAHATVFSCTLGVVISAVVAALAMYGVSRRLTRRTVRELHQGASLGVVSGSRRRTRVLAALGAALVVAAGIILAMAEPGRGKEAAGAFFAAGALLLTGILDLFYLLLRHLGHGGVKTSAVGGAGALSVRNCGRHPGRSLAVSGILSCAVFLVIAVGANRHGPPEEVGARDSGTGGFAFYGESSLPILRDLNTETGREALGVGGAPELDGVSMVQMALRPGDDASCLNLNRVSVPSVLGVDPRELDQRGAFSFAKLVPGADRDRPWLVLQQEQSDGAIPAVADQTVIVWGLGKSIGDTIETEDEQGRPLTLRLVGGLANSVLQGHVLVSNEHFRDAFPSISGARVFLVDTPPEKRSETAAFLHSMLRNYGLALTPAGERLAAFNTVENTYLAIFLALGGLALLLGSVGLGVVVLRNVLERRRELALLGALGFPRLALVRMVTTEHAVLLAAGVLVGGVAGAMAVLPAVFGPGGVGGFTEAAWALAGVLVFGVVWVAVSALGAMRGDFVPALRDE